MRTLTNTDIVSISGGHSAWIWGHYALVQYFTGNGPIIADPMTRVVLLTTTALFCAGTLVYLSNNNDGQCH